MTEIWTKWESRVINGVFPLRRFVGTSDHSVVFLTEYKAQNLANAAIKLVPGDPALDEAQLSRWRLTSSLSHPHLLRLFDAGRCQLGGHNFLFVVMEYAEQTLAEVLPNRALTLEEVREMLIPTLDALTFLHRKNLVHGGLKPPNTLVVGDRLKLASDTIRPAGEYKARITKPSLYDPPEARSGISSAAADIWALGVTLVEALRQKPPAWSDDSYGNVSLPDHLPYEDVIRRCLNRNPAHRPTLVDLAAQITRSPPASAVSIAPTEVQVAAEQAMPQRQPAKMNLFIATVAAALTMVAAIWAAVNLFGSGRNSQQALPTSSQTPSRHAPAPEAASQNPVTPSPAIPAPIAPLEKATGPSVVHEEIPNVPRRTREAIHGRIRVAVRVTVDRSGNVVAETVDVPGSSKYFARLAAEAAVKWKFAPADSPALRKWLMHFEFSRGGITAHATGPRS
jgi:serine/threonine protein kinase